MAAGLTIEYDPVGDILFIRRVAPHPGQVIDMEEADLLVRRNEATEEVEGVDILFASQRLAEGGIRLPFDVDLEALLPFLTQHQQAA